MKKFVILTICILVPLIIGGLGGIATASGVDTWYNTIQRPSFNPPNYLFGPVWTFLYILMGISFYMILQATPGKDKARAIIIFCVQLALNSIWSFLFFSFHWLGIAFIEILMILISILTMIILFYKINKSAALLQIPYLLWVSFATVLNGSFWLLNS